MNNTLAVHWFDDIASKVEDAKESLRASAADAGFNLDLVFHAIKPDLEGIKDAIESIKTSPNDLLLVDHKINDPGSMVIKGSAIAHLLRLNFPNTPIVCVSAAWSETQPNKSFDQEDLSEYACTIAYSSIHDQAEFLRTIATDFSKVCSAVEKQVSVAQALLNAPTDDCAELDRILPTEFHLLDQKSTPHHFATTPHRLAHWILNTFLKRPGFLYDRMRVATMLGLSVQGFSKVQDKFSRAEYTGIFKNNATPLWWVSEINNILYELLPELHTRSQLAGRELPRINQVDHSKCWVEQTNEAVPDAVAYIDMNNNEEVPVNSRNTRIHPKDDPTLPGFEARLVISTKARG
jgi:hypothetical protein